MVTKRLRGKELAAKLRAEIETSSRLLERSGGLAPVLVTLLVGSHPSAEAYRGSINRTFQAAGIAHSPLVLPATTSEDALIETILDLNRDPTVTGVLALMPLPDHLNPHVVLEHLSPLKDVDGITPTNAGRLHLGLPSLRPSTPQGGIELLDFYGIPIAGQRITVIGRSNVVGRPLATMLTQRHATVTLCHRQTRNLAGTTRHAEIVAVAAGHPRLVTGDMVAPGATVLDFGVNVEAGGIIGDADPDSLMDIAGALTPVPGGTGPVTALVLARNTIAAGFAAMSGNLDHVQYVLPDRTPAPVGATASG